MLNKIWFWMLLIGLLYGPVRAVVAPLLQSVAVAVGAVEEGIEGGIEGGIDEKRVEVPAAPTAAELGRRVTEAALDGANVAVELCLSLVGVMVLWLGILQVAKDAGLVEALARALRPLMRWLFPEVPDGHPAQGAMLMNISANMLGLDNAATPFGLRAMRDLETLNPHKGTATNSMATFLAINNSSVTLVPIGVIALRVAAGSKDPAGPLFGMLLATMVSTAAAVILVKWLEKRRRFDPDSGDEATPPSSPAAEGTS
ncbi:MAG: nucleoside recognition domain-containing protein [Lacipirellulaceae bacterium]